ncbi:TadE/TadG family type IV pilus assembly protein [Methylobacterium sp. J-090]|uniref:TadE/TadG family type IV pilus assembly protein n=1 Tax=Methylobacterium sp. J-090 TaxID=2836666 RepID=UPI001FBBE45A|nr:TadE/TadG family type IV pilus assembly protein [Methylobacterium sp. J-090]MCJ2082707.1 pilus assembly protein [Methylobacterium sp. J-090]
MISSITGNGTGAGRTARGKRRFGQDRSGATVVEFALLALPFLLIASASLEAGLTYFSQEILQQAVTDAGRQIYTGQFQVANVGTTDKTALLDRFRSALCNPIGQPPITIFNCANVRVSITEAATFGGAAPVDAVVADNTGALGWNPSFATYTCGRANAVIIAQAAVDIPVFVPALGIAGTFLPNGRRVLQAATVFQVEPFNSSATCS